MPLLKKRNNKKPNLTMNVFRKIITNFSYGLSRLILLNRLFFFKKKRKLFLEFKMMSQSSFIKKKCVAAFLNYFLLVFWL